MRLSRLRGRKINTFLRTRGRIWKGKTLLLHWLPGHPRRPGVDLSHPAVYLGTYASAKLSKKAMERNRMRRRCREAVRLEVAAHDILPAVQLLLCPRSPSLTCSFEDIQTDVRSFLSSLRA